MNIVKVFETEIEVEEHHLDENLHVNNVQYLQWVQDNAKAHWEQEAKPEWLDLYIWVALSHHIEYKKLAFHSDLLKLQTSIKSFEGPKSNRWVKITRSDTGELICQCETVWCMLDKTTGKPMRVLSEMEEAFEELS